MDGLGPGHVVNLCQCGKRKATTKTASAPTSTQRQAQQRVGQRKKRSSTHLVSFALGLEDGQNVNLELHHNGDLDLADGVLEEAVDVQVRGHGAQRSVAAELRVGVFELRAESAVGDG